MIGYLVLVFPVLMAVAAVNDLLTMTISNRLSIALVVAFAIAAPLAGLSLQTIAIHVGLAVLMLGVGFGLFALNVFGGGDGKLLAAASLWVGWSHFLPFLVFVAMLGGALSVLLLLYRQLAPPRFLLGQAWAMRLHDKTTGVPYGVAMAGGALLVFPSTVWSTLGA